MQRRVGGAVEVQVVEHDELGAGGLRGADDGVLEGWELLGPAVVVGGVEAEVHRVGIRGDLAGETLVGGVAADGLDAGERRGAAAVDHPNVGASAEERIGDGGASGPGAEDDVRLGGHERTVLGMNAPTIVLCRKVELIAP